MAIETHSPRVEAERRMLLKLLAWNYPAEAAERFPRLPPALHILWALGRGARRI